MHRPNLVVAKHRFLGDTMVTLPLVQYIASVARVDRTPLPMLLTGSGPAVLLQNHPDIGRLLTISRDASKRSSTASRLLWKEYLSMASELRATGAPGTCYLADRSFRSAIFARLTGAKVIVGFPTEGRGFLLHQRIPYSQTATEVDTILALAGTDQASSGQTPRLYLSDDDQAVISDKQPGTKRVAIQPGASHGYKQYPELAWKSLIQSIRTIGADVYLVGGPEEQSAVDALNVLLGDAPAPSLVGKTSLRSLMATLHEFNLVISADTGVSHVAAAVGTPTLTLFGPTPIHKWGRNYAPHRALQAPDADMSKLSPDMVAAVVQEQLS
jgi:ADP-heptose:LPS heptosyltransferase